MKKAELVALCEELGLDAEGTVKDLRALLLDHKDEWPSDDEAVVEAEDDGSHRVSLGNLGIPSTDPEAMTEDEFIEAAYEAILNRAADPGGKKHYFTNLLMGGCTRQELIDDLLASEEAKALR